MSKQIVDVAVGDVVLRNDLYPRLKKSPETVERYQGSLEKLPPIEINQHNILIDGWHRWTAHRQADAKMIRAFVTETRSDIHLLELSIVRNATHGLQLSPSDKKARALQLWGLEATAKEKAEREKSLVELLSVNRTTVGRWLAGNKKEFEKQQREKMHELWLQCYTQDEIAEAVGEERRTVARRIEIFGQNVHLHRLSKDFDPDFTDYKRDLFDVWAWSKRADATIHFGNSDKRIVQNLLALYTKPGEIVIDPFAGGGSTLDVCKKHFRRCWVSDLTPKPSREEIRQLDICNELPDLNRRWPEVSLVYLDPPYWRQAEGKYSKSDADLANMPLDAFHDSLFDVLKRFVEKMPSGAKIALLIQPTQWKNEDKHVDDHMFEMRCRMAGVGGVRFVQKVSVPYSTEQYNPQQVEKAKEKGLLMVISRELCIWEVK